MPSSESPQYHVKCYAYSYYSRHSRMGALKFALPLASVRFTVFGRRPRRERELHWEKGGGWHLTENSEDVGLFQ